MEESKPKQLTPKPAPSALQHEKMVNSPEESKTPGTAVSERLDEVDPALVEQVIKEFVRSGECRVAWAKSLPLLKKRLESVADRYQEEKAELETEEFEERKTYLLEKLAGYSESPPFTIQRLCELLHEPERTYKSLRKLLNAFDKLVNVGSN